MDKKQQSELSKLLKASKLAVVSTVSSNTTPESALVSFVEDDSHHIYFQTRVESRKFANLSQNQKISIVIGWDLKGLKTLQYEGLAQPLNQGKLEDTKKLLLKKNPALTKHHLDNESTRFFIVHPVWLRYSDYTFPPNIWEFTFD